MDGIGPEQTREFYRAAAGFYRQSPWRAVDETETIEVRCAQLVGGPWYAVVLGRRGKLIGLMLFEGWEGRALMARRGYDAIADRLDTMAVYFEDHRQMRPADVEAARAHGFDVAGPCAYPFACRMEQGRRCRAPSAWELELLEGCLHVIPSFLKRAADRRADVFEYAFDGTIGRMTLDLSWVPRDRR
jgi:hypothetical protein